MPISYADACAGILGEPSGMLYLDTCVFLDIVRSPVRESIDSNSAKFAQALIGRATSHPRTLWLITSATVETEWAENIDGEKHMDIHSLKTKVNLPCVAGS